MSKLLIYIGEKQTFDLEKTVPLIQSMAGVTNARRGKFIGAVFECEYAFGGETTVVRISDDLETVTVEGLGREAADFAVKLQQRLDVPLRAIDMDYSFDLALSNFSSEEEFRRAMAS
jgi:hypothetical protein